MRLAYSSKDPSEGCPEIVTVSLDCQFLFRLHIVFWKYKLSKEIVVFIYKKIVLEMLK